MWLKINSNSTVNLNEIHFWVLKSCAKVLANPLSVHFRRPLKSGQLPG